MGYYTGDDLPYHYWLATEFAMSDAWFYSRPYQNPAQSLLHDGRDVRRVRLSLRRRYRASHSSQDYLRFSASRQAFPGRYIRNFPSGYTYASVFADFMSQYGSTGNIVVDPTFSQFIADAKNGNLAAVTFIDKPDADEKPDGTADNIQDGVAETHQLINAVMYGPSWNNTVLIFTFDEGGGLYDHVVPPTNVPSPDGIQPVDICTSATDPALHLRRPDAQHPALRSPRRLHPLRLSRSRGSDLSVPKADYVSHVTTDNTAWLKLVEKRFSLKPLNARDGWSGTSDMSDFFDFQNPPWATPPANAPSDSGGVCVDTLP